MEALKKHYFLFFTLIYYIFYPLLGNRCFSVGITVVDIENRGIEYYIQYLIVLYFIGGTMISAITPIEISEKRKVFKNIIKNKNKYFISSLIITLSYVISFINSVWYFSYYFFKISLIIYTIGMFFYLLYVPKNIYEEYGIIFKELCYDNINILRIGFNKIKYSFIVFFIGILLLILQLTKYTISQFSFILLLCVLYITYLSFMGIITSLTMGTHRKYFMIYLCTYTIISTIIMYVLLHYEWIYENVTPNVQLIFSAAFTSTIFSVCLMSAIGSVFNFIFISPLTGLYVIIVDRLSLIWTWIKNKEHKQIEYGINTYNEDKNMLRLIINIAIELFLSSIWFILYFIKERISITETTWTLVGSVSLFCMMTYPFIIMERREIYINGKKMGPNILHKFWSMLTIIALMSQLSNFKPENLYTIAINFTLFINTVFGYTFGYLSSERSSMEMIGPLRGPLRTAGTSLGHVHPPHDSVM